LDFRPGVDRVERKGGVGYIVDPEGLYADVKIDGDVMLPDYGSKLAPVQVVKMMQVVKHTPFLSPEGRKERLHALATRLALTRGELTFVVAYPPQVSHV
jgi:hypothetical protein